MRNKPKIIFLATLFLLLSLFGTTAYAVEIVPKSAEELIVDINTDEAVKPLFPISVSEEINNGYMVITKTYALTPDENPAYIDKKDFVNKGISYVLSDVIMRENREDEVLEHTEIVEVNTSTDKIADVIAQLNPEQVYEQNGYYGVLHLDISSISCEPAGYKTSSYELSEERVVRNLATQDTSVFDKSISVSGRNYTLKNVNFSTDSNALVDHESVASSYIGTAVYTATGSSSKVTGYITKAVYTGEISKTIVDKTYYSVQFISAEPIVVPEPEPVPESEPTPMLVPEATEKSFELPEIFLPIMVTLITIAVVTGTSILVAYAFMLFNVTIYNQDKDGHRFNKVGRVRLKYKSGEQPVIDIESAKFKGKNKAASNKFVIEFTEKATKDLVGKEIFVRYKGKEISHIVENDEGYRKYQFEVNFDE